MQKQFIYPIDHLTIQSDDGAEWRIAPLAEILLVAEVNSERIGSLKLAIRFRTHCDALFMQLDVPDRIKKENYPEGHDPKDPAKSIARKIEVGIKLGDGNGSVIQLVCGDYSQEICSRLTPIAFLEKVHPEEKYSRDDVDDEDICVPPV